MQIFVCGGVACRFLFVFLSSQCRDGKLHIEQSCDGRSKLKVVLENGAVWLRSTWSLDGHSVFSYSVDGVTFCDVMEYGLSWDFYRGGCIDAYNYNDVSDEWLVDVGFFHYEF